MFLFFVGDVYACVVAGVGVVYDELEGHHALLEVDMAFALDPVVTLPFVRVGPAIEEVDYDK